MNLSVSNSNRFCFQFQYQTLLEECKYKLKKVKSFITDDLESSSDDDYEEKDLKTL